MEPRVEIECNVVSLWGFVNRISRGARKKYSYKGLKGDTLAISGIYTFAAIYLFCFFALIYPLYILCTVFIAISTLLDLVWTANKIKNIYIKYKINKYNMYLYSIRIYLTVIYIYIYIHEKQIRTNTDTTETIEIIQITIYAQIYVCVRVLLYIIIRTYANNQTK
jgi:hypothetical protein